MAKKNDLPGKGLSLPPGVPVVYLRSALGGIFIYEKMIEKVVGNPKNGDFVAVVDKFGNLFGWAFYNARSKIALRMFSNALSMPTDEDIQNRIHSAVSLRRDFLKLDEVSDSYRIIHSEGDGLSGLVADKMGDYIVLEFFSIAMFRRFPLIEETLVDAGFKVKAFVHRADKNVLQQEGFHLSQKEDLPESKTIIHENGVQFWVQLEKGHKTGFFCDQRENRLFLSKFTPGKNVLDLCCYTGGFACYSASIGKAAQVNAVDLDEKVLPLARENADLNEAKISFEHSDAFEYLRKAHVEKKKWHVVVVDPSKFAPSRNDIEKAIQKYTDLNRLAIQVVEPGGILLTCSCSGLVEQAAFVDLLGRSAKGARRTLQIFKITGAGPDHPVMAHAPESSYLKAVWARVL